MTGNSKTRILFITQGNRDHASSRIRCLQYFPMLSDAGFDCRWLPRIPAGNKKVLYRRLIFPVLKRMYFSRIILEIMVFPYDILFVQRMFLPPVLLKMARKRGATVIFDFDDAIYVSGTDPEAEIKTRAMVENADQVIVSNSFLEKYALSFNPNVSRITSPVKVTGLKLHKGGTVITIGWIGSEWTSKYLSALLPVFIRLREKYPVHFLFVGCRKDVLQEINPEIIPWSQETENTHLSGMDLGIMPLDDGEFERGKGGYKLLQYMAAGLPVVASPVGINTEIIHEGENGFLCHTPEEWFSALEKLVQEEPLRNSMGEAGFRMVRDNYSLEVCFRQLRQILDKLRQYG